MTVLEALKHGRAGHSPNVDSPPLWQRGPSQELLEARGVVKGAWRTVAAWWEALPDGYEKKALFLALHGDRLLVKTELAVDYQMKKLDSEVLQTEAKKILTNVREGMEFFVSRARKIMKC